MKSEMTATTNFAPVSIDSQPLAVEGLSVGSYGNYDHSYFMKDCGSTRMVLDQNGTIKQALMYQHCRTIAPVAGIPRTGSDPLRDKFTSKEFDEDGDANWAPGIKAYHFKVQMYDSDFERWQTDDYQDDFWTKREPPKTFDYWEMW